MVLINLLCVVNFAVSMNLYECFTIVGGIDNYNLRKESVLGKGGCEEMELTKGISFLIYVKVKWQNIHI